MRPQALDDLRAAIEQNTERRSLDELKAEGKKHVRVVSGEKVMNLIRAIVGDLVEREAGALNVKDRERIAQDTKQQFDRVMKLQTDQDMVINEQREIIAQHKQQLDDLGSDHQRLARELDDSRNGERIARQAVAQLEERLERMKVTIQNYDRELEATSGQTKSRQEELEELKRRIAAQEQQLALSSAQLEESRTRERLANEALSEMEQRLGEAKATIQNCDREIQRLSLRLNDDDSLLDELKDALQAKELEAERLQGKVNTLQEQLDLTRQGQEESEGAAVDGLRGELAEMRAMISGMEARRPEAEEATVSKLMEKLAEREGRSADEMDGRFSESLDKALNQITRTMEAATARPIDIRVEATDVLVDKLFDIGDEELSSNLDQLDVEVKSAKGGIAANLARLKALRSTSSGSEESDS